MSSFKIRFSSRNLIKNFMKAGGMGTIKAREEPFLIRKSCADTIDKFLSDFVRLILENLKGQEKGIWEAREALDAIRYAGARIDWNDMSVKSYELLAKELNTEFTEEKREEFERALVKRMLRI